MRRILPALVAITCLVSPASAGDLVVGAETDLRFDDNVYGTTRNEVSDGYFTIAPTFEFAERWRTLSGALNFWPTYEVFFDEDLNGFNYDADGTLQWKPTERTTFSLYDDFRRYRSMRELETGGVTRAGREWFNQNIAQLSVSHRTSPRGTLYLSGWHTLWEFESVLRTDQSSGAAAIKYDHLVTDRTRIGGSVQFSRQTVRPEVGQSSHTDYYNASFTMSYVPAETLFVKASIGPTLVRQPKASSRFPSSVFRGNVIRVDGAGNPRVGIVGTCPTLPSGDVFDGPGCTFVTWPLAPQFLRLGDAIPVVSTVSSPDRDSWTYFADVEVSKEWQNARLSGSYRRDQGSNAALGFTTVADTIALTTSWRPLQKLSFYFTTSWEDREQSDEGRSRLGSVILLDTLPPSGSLPPVNNLVPVGVVLVPATAGDEARVTSFSVSFGGDYFLHAALKLEAQAGWGDQNASRGSGFGDSDRFWLRIGLDFEYGPIRW
jgi:hypothetical protein